MIQSIFQEWFDNHFVPSVKSHFRKVGLPEDSKAVLMLDNCYAHPKIEDLQNGNIFAALLPPNTTSLIQPVDQGVIENLKSHYRKDFMRKFCAHHGTLKEFHATFNIKTAIWYVVKGWELSVYFCVLAYLYY